MQVLLIWAFLIAAEGLSIHEVSALCCDHWFLACPSCFPTCQGQGFTSVPACNNPNFNGTWLINLFFFTLLTLLIVYEQGSFLQSNHIYIERHLQWSWQLDHTVGYFTSFHLELVIHALIINRNMAANRIASISNGIFTGLGSLTILFVN